MKFAHMADVHLGAHREPHIRKLELEVFEAAMSRCVDIGVDFVLICGDLFHVGIPDLGVVNSALKAMVKVRKAGIPIYTIYGSHDYTPNGTSVIDILSTAGAITNVSSWRVEDGKLKLDVFVDEKTGAKLAGISARRIGLESKYYEILDRETLEAEQGFRIFAFHSGITQFKPAHLKEMETLDMSVFPRGWEYYAGGHIHQRGEYSLDGYDDVVFPGALFTGYGKDVEETAKGVKRGFYLVEFDTKVRTKEFVELESFDGIYREYDLGGMNTVEANKVLKEGLAGLDVKDRVVVLRTSGELAGGRVADIDFAGLKARLAENGALYVYLNRAALTSREASKASTLWEDIATMERQVFEDGIAKVKVSQPHLTGERGVLVSRELLRIMRQPAKLNELKRDYSSRIVHEGERIVGMEEGV